MTFLPVVERELRAATRRAATRRSRLIFACVAVLVVGLALLFFSTWAARGTGGGVFRFVVFLLFGYCSLAGLFLTADCLSVERREGTLGLLFLTNLHSYDVVLGKLVAQALTAFYGWLAVLPVLSVSMLLGGVTGGEFWRIVLTLASTLFVSLTIGLAVSALVDDDSWTIKLTFLLILLVCAGPPVIAPWVAALGWPEGAAAVPQVISPVMSCLAAFDSPYRSDPMFFWRSLAAGQVLGWGALFLAFVSLPRRWQQGVAPTGLGRLRRCLVGWGNSKGQSRSGPIRNHPVAWLSTRTALMSRQTLWVILLLSLLSWALVQRVLPPGSWDFLNAPNLLGMVLRVVMVFQAVRFFVLARQSGAMELLLATPLSPREMVDGQIVALRRLFLWPAVLVMAIHLLPVVGFTTFNPSLLGGTTQPLDRVLDGGLGVYGMIVFVADLYAAAWLGLLLGLGSRRPRYAPLMALLFLIVLPTIAFCIPRILIDLPIIFAAQDRSRREFRLLARRAYEQGSRRPVWLPDAPPPLPTGAPN